MTGTVPAHRPGPAPTAVVFDIGKVLIEWDPRHLYRDLFAGDEDLMEHFLATVCTPEWNLEQDRGRPWDEAVRVLSEQHPQCTELIRAFDDCWDAMVPDAIDGTPEILAALKERGTPVYAITNFSAAKFERTRRRFDFLTLFDGIVVSGEVGLVKPDPAIYRRLLDDHRLDPADLYFIDDSGPNIDTARALGMTAHHFAGAGALRREMESLGLL